MSWPVPYACVTYLPRAKNPTKSTPNTPQPPCMGAAERGSSMWNRSRRSQSASNRSAASTPHRTAAAGSSTEHPAVTETRPARMALQAAPRSQWPHFMRARNRPLMPPLAPARVVVTAVRPTISNKTVSSPVSPMMANADPGLNPYHPNHSMNVPNTTSVIEWPWKFGAGLPSLPKRPLLGPIIMAPINPAMPPTACTTPLPAKSIMPESKRGSELNALRYPSSAQIQCTTTG
mmetsp:Transcript_2117/g.3616  ORF Transcript_2117/g.3616 Transcript_2117/m.3616 type:complete len:233 (-) Transcript_2117:774-1472(-)